MSSLYGEYIKERLGKEILEVEEGFATYYFVDTKCYLEDIYVKPEFRRDNIGKILADRISSIAKEHGCAELLGSVVPSAKGSTASLHILLSYGFELDSCVNNFIVFKKGLSNG